MILAKLDPYRPTRRFTQPLPLEDPSADIKEKQAARQERLVSTKDDIDLEKIKAHRLEESKRAAERYILYCSNRIFF